MSKRHILTILTVLMVGLIIFLARHDLLYAWHLLTQVNIWILLLIFPLQALSYYAIGAMIFSYLKQKGSLRTHSFETAKMALEFNFVNHVLPSGGVSGMSYLTWRLKHLGVSAAKATLAQAVRFLATFIAYLALLLVALIIITFDGSINRLTILVTSGMASVMVFGTVTIAYVIGNQQRLEAFSRWFSRWINRLGQKILHRDKELIAEERVREFFSEMHDDYRVIRREPGLLVRPIVWGFVFTITEVAMFLVTFWALGTPINPAPLLIAYGVATIAGFFVVTPGGLGGYELLMIAFLGSAGISQGASVAAVLLTRTLLIVTTILSGYIFYQIALGKYGKHTAER